MDAKILVIDDDIDLPAMLRDIFIQERYRFFWAMDGIDGLEALQDCRPDLVLLDVMLPRMDGWEVCQRIRQVSDVPIIMLTALGQERDLVRGLELGADDYVAKPFRVAELRARVRSILRRHQHFLAGDLEIQIDERLILDRVNCCVHVAGRLVALSSVEYNLLDYLVENADRLLTHQTLLSRVWGWEHVGDIAYLKVYIYRLRKKIERNLADPFYIITERGLGYRFHMPKS